MIIARFIKYLTFDLLGAKVFPFIGHTAHLANKSFLILPPPRKGVTHARI